VTSWYQSSRLHGSHSLQTNLVESEGSVRRRLYLSPEATELGKLHICSFLSCGSVSQYWLNFYSVLSQMDRTRASSSTAQQLEPPATASTRGRGRGRGRGRVQPRAAAPVAELQVDFEEEVPAPAVPMGPAQVPEGFIAAPVLQDTLVRLVGLIESVTRAGLLPVAPATSQAVGGA